MTTDLTSRRMKPEDLIAWANTLSRNPETSGAARSCLEQIAEALSESLLAHAVAVNAARSDYESLEEDAARVVLAYICGDTTGIDETIGKMKDNGRKGWWEAHRPAGLRREKATP